jgi:hypothetical protein
MGKLFLSMLIGAIVILVANDDTRTSLGESLRGGALAVAGVVQR